MRLFLSDEPLAQEMLAERRTRCGLTERDVAHALLLSPAQVRAIEAGSLKPFYGQSYYDRARVKYLALLDKHLEALKLQTPMTPVADAANTDLRITLSTELEAGATHSD